MCVSVRVRRELEEERKKRIGLEARIAALQETHNQKALELERAARRELESKIDSMVIQHEKHTHAHTQQEEDDPRGRDLALERRKREALQLQVENMHKERRMNDAAAEQERQNQVCIDV
jgi:hypothetical protein